MFLFGFGFNTLFVSKGDTLSRSHVFGAVNSSINSLPIDIFNTLNSLIKARIYLGAKYRVEGVIG